MKKSVLFIISALIIITLVLSSCASADTDSASSANAENADAVASDEVVYEAVFVDNELIANLFSEVRGDAPYANESADYHVTTAFRPEEESRELYGMPVTVHITGYKAGDVTTDDGVVTQNEGFKAELSSDDPGMSAYIESHLTNFHITGSYADAAKYTEYLDFSDAESLDCYVEGTFGAFLGDGSVTYGASDDAGESIDE